MGLRAPSVHASPPGGRQRRRPDGHLRAGIFANYIAPYSYKEIPYITIAGTSVIDTSQILAHPSRQHLFGTDSAGRDTFSRTLYGIRTSARVGIFVGLLSTLIGTIIGGLAGFYGGWSDNLLMRMTDLFLTLPLLAVLLTASKFLDSSTPTTLAILIACLIWTSIARIVRGVFLSLREKEYTAHDGPRYWSRSDRR